MRKGRFAGTWRRRTGPLFRRAAHGDAMELMLGEAWNPDTGSRGQAVSYDFSTHATVMAPTGSGKGVGIEIPNLLAGLRDTSCLNPDPSGQNASVCAAARR